MRLILSTLALFAAAFSYPGVHVAPQNTEQEGKAREILLEASGLIMDIPKDQQTSAVANIAGQLARAGDLSDAFATVQVLKDDYYRTEAMGIIAWQLAATGNFARALVVIENCQENDAKEAAYEGLAQLRANTGDIEGALQIVRRIHASPRRQTETLLFIASERAKAGDISRAREIVAEAMTVADEAVMENASQSYILTQLAATQLAIGDPFAASLTLYRFSAIAHEYTGVERDFVFLRHLAEVQARMGDLSGAQRTSDEMQPGNSDGALMAISVEQAKEGQLDNALETAARISNTDSRTSTLRGIAMIRGTHGPLNDALVAIERIPGLTERAEALATLALEQAENNNIEASRTLQMVSELATEVGADPSGDVHGKIAVTRAILGDFAGAKQIVSEMTKPESRVWPLWNITSMLVNAGREQEALNLAENEESSYPKLYALLGTAEGVLNKIVSEEKTRTHQK